MNSKINIGDKVYMCIENRVEEFEVEWVRYVDEQYAYKTKRSEIDGAVRGFFDYDIGRGVYLTREEAETERAERERLVELLDNFVIKCPEDCTRVEVSCVKCTYRQVADHLIANGVRVELPRNDVSLVDGHIEE